MNDKKENNFKNTYRAWFEWFLWAIWFILGCLFLQASIASYREYETRAAIIYAGLFFSFLIGGLVVWFVRNNELL
ncbi:hypothetical protein ACFLYP_01430 [Chloroflexota bacterium]